MRSREPFTLEQIARIFEVPLVYLKERSTHYEVLEYRSKCIQKKILKWLRCQLADEKLYIKRILEGEDMSIFKGKEVRLLKARVDNNERRLTQVECKHIEQYFNDYRRDESDPWWGGQVICGNCEKLIRQYSDEAAFLKAKHEIMKDIIERDRERIAELEKG